MQTVARRVTTIGNIRIGYRVPIKGGRHAGEPRPERLKHFRLTSNSRSALELAARQYGGEVQAWTVPPEWKDKVPPPEQSWELFTTSEVLNILFHPDGVMTTTWEEWQGGYCVLRCNGQYIIKDGSGKRVGERCRCPSDPRERKALAAKKPPEACEEISRVAVFLEGVPVHEWRLSTKGFYAPAEIRGLQDILRACEVADMLVRAQMRLEWRTDKKMEDGQPSTLIYPVVVLEPRQSADELLAIGEERRQRQLRPATERKQLAEHITDLSEPLDPTARPRQEPPAVAVVPSVLGVGDDLPAGEAGAEYIHQIEAAVLALPNPRPDKLEEWWKWAERRFDVDRRDFTMAHYQEFLAKVRTAAQQLADRAAQKRQEGTQGAHEGSGEGQPSGTSTTTPGLSTGAESPDLFLQEEEQEQRAEEFGNG